jgi:hypothetical protein
VIASETSANFYLTTPEDSHLQKRKDLDLAPFPLLSFCNFHFIFQFALLCMLEVNGVIEP